MNISFIGAGKVASSLGSLFVDAGHSVKYGVQQPNEKQLSLEQACKFGEIVCFAIPFQAMEEVLITHKDSLKNKIVIDINNVINLEDWSPIFLGENSGGEITHRLLPDSKVVKAFNTIFADTMSKDDQDFSSQKLTAFIASDDIDAATIVKNLADEIGFEGLIVDGIKNARHLEAIAHLNIAIALGGGGTNAGFKYFKK